MDRFWKFEIFIERSGEEKTIAYVGDNFFRLLKTPFDWFERTSRIVD